MPEVIPIEFDHEYYAVLRKSGLAPPDDLVEQSIRNPTALESIPLGEAPIHIAMLRTEMAGRSVLVFTVFVTTTKHAVWLSLLGPSYMDSPYPTASLGLFAQRFGVHFVLGGRVLIFASRVIVPFNPAEGATLAQPLVDDTCSISMFAPMVIGGNEIRVGLMLAIDMDHYARWRQTYIPEPLVGTRIEIDPSVSRTVTVKALLDTRMSLALSLSEAPRSDIELFSVITDGFEFRAGIQENEVYLHRNESRVAASLPERESEIGFGFRWTPHMLEVATVSKRNPTDNKSAVQATTPTVPPRRLLAWARRQRTNPEFLYEDANHFYRTVLDMLIGVEDKILYADMIGAFWNKQEDGILTPKREVDVHRIVDGLLFDTYTAKNLQCFPETRIDGGNIDFYISGILTNGQHEGVCLEFKNAHATDVYHGLETQLPAYMDSRASDRGIYCVLYYKCDYFQRPTKDVYEFGVELERRRVATGRNIAIQMWELGIREPPSKR